jgi:putative hydrolase of the HAD superfamily
MKAIRAIIFDLYGTLLRFDSLSFLRELKHAMTVSHGRLSALSLRRLLVRVYPNESDMLSDWCRAVGVERPTTAQISRCRAVLDKHVREITQYAGARTLLSFLRRKEFKLGLLSNTAELFTTPLKTHDLESLFDQISHSCDAGRTKPDATLYLDLCKKLEVHPEECLFIGDSLENDYRAPIALGMQALRLRGNRSSSAEFPDELSQIVWASLREGPTGLRRMIASQMKFSLNGSSLSITSVETLTESQQGRYNVVGRVWAKDETGKERECYCKRYVTPESAYVEETAYRLMNLLGMLECRATLFSAEEPLLLSTPASGVLWTASEIDEITAEAIGAHCAAAYLIGNADLRPRNTFVDRSNGVAKVSVIDLEHCFFDRAMDLQQFPGRFSPQEIDKLGDSVEERTKHRVVSPAGIRRTRRSYLPIDDMSNPRVQRLRKGWLSMYENAKSLNDKIEYLLMDRIYQDPPLIIGTQSYRRAMAAVDVRDILHRVSLDANDAFKRLY